MNTEIVIYMSPDGSDDARGGIDSPLRTVGGVIRLIGDMTKRGERTVPVRVCVRGGEYRLERPIEIKTLYNAPVRFEAYEGEKPVFTGGQRVEGFTESTVNGCRAWVADVCDILKSCNYFHQLFVNGQRRERPRLPKQGYFVMEDVPDIDGRVDCWSQFFNGTHRFVYKEGDLGAFRNVSDIEIVAHHFWVDERMPIASLDADSRLVTSSARAVFVLKNDNNRAFASYYAENVFEALTEPGQWYLDREAKLLYYLPFDSEEIGECEIIAPALSQLLTVSGDPENNRFIDNLTFSGITFEYADWHHTMPIPKQSNEYFGTGGFDRGPMPCATAPQAALHCPGVISFRGVRNCALADCVIRHVGFYGVELRDGCSGCAVTGCEICDTGAGGIRTGGACSRENPNLATCENRFENNLIHAGGRVFRSGVGILLVHSAGNRVTRNTIHDYYYTGISSGWIWGFGDNISRENLIEYNHIYDLGKGVISDMGGVYILGIQAGTVIRGNLIHDIVSCNYGGWGIYLDEGASYVVVENNLVRNVSSQCFNQHYGRENVVRNNIFAFSRDCVAHIQRSNTKKAECPVSSYTKHAVTFERNVFISDGKPFHIFDTTPPEDGLFNCIGNVYWNTEFKDQTQEMMGDDRYGGRKRVLSMEDLQKLGMFALCECADPKIELNDDGYVMAKDSPALTCGFTPFDLSCVGADIQSRR